MINQFNTNVFGLLNITKAVLPYMRQKKNGIIINLSSGAGWEGFLLQDYIQLQSLQLKELLKL